MQDVNATLAVICQRSYHRKGRNMYTNYFMNRHSLINMFSFGSPVVFSVVELMSGKVFLDRSFQDFYTECYNVLQQKATPAEIAMFPKGAAAFSRALKGMEVELKRFGITFGSEQSGLQKGIRLFNDGSVISNGSAK